MFSFPDRVNQVSARLVAAWVASSIAVALLAGQPWIVALLAIGFILRVGWGPRFSPLARAAVAMAPHLTAPQPVAGAPKRFAQGIGALCTLSATALFLSGHATAARLVAGLVLGFAVLEAGIAFCAGCWVYVRLQRAGLIAADACDTCVSD